MLQQTAKQRHTSTDSDVDTVEDWFSQHCFFRTSHARVTAQCAGESEEAFRARIQQVMVHDFECNIREWLCRKDTSSQRRSVDVCSLLDVEGPTNSTHCPYQCRMTMSFESFLAENFPENIRITKSNSERTAIDAAECIATVEWIDQRVTGESWRGAFERLRREYLSKRVQEKEKADQPRHRADDRCVRCNVLSVTDKQDTDLIMNAHETRRLESLEVTSFGSIASALVRECSSKIVQEALNRVNIACGTVMCRLLPLPEPVENQPSISAVSLMDDILQSGTNLDNLCHHIDRLEHICREVEESVSSMQLQAKSLKPREHISAKPMTAAFMGFSRLFPKFSHIDKQKQSPTFWPVAVTQTD